jgi:Tol biopolymer transport system component
MVNSSSSDVGTWMSPDGLELYFNSNRPGGYGGLDIYVARRATTSDPWGDPVNLGPVVNSAYNENDVSLSPDGLLLFFDDGLDAPRPGGYGGADMWMARRTSLSDPWQAPLNLGPKVNGSAHDGGARIFPDGSTLYFTTLRDGTYDNWRASILPVVDFSGDGIVDCVDICMLVDHLDTNEPLYDIAPVPLGDGIVDVQDLIVLTEHLTKKQVDPNAMTP